MTKPVQRADAVDRDKIGNIGFAASFVLPGEDKLEFVELMTSLAEEYGAQSHLEVDALGTLAQALWRKQHLGVFKLAAEARGLYGHLFRFPNDDEGFWKYISLHLKHFATIMQAIFEKHKKHQEFQGWCAVCTGTDHRRDAARSIANSGCSSQLDGLCLFGAAGSGGNAGGPAPNRSMA